MKTFDCERLSRSEQYKLLTGAVSPRPVALVTTMGSHGVNAAPFSFFNVLGVEPPMILFSVGMRADADKDTVRNLKQHPELVVHLVDEATAEPMNQCSAALPYGVNELEFAGLQTVASDVVQVPRIAACPVHFECVLHRLEAFGKVPYHLVIARIVRMHFRDDVVDDHYHVDAQALKAIGRVTGAGMYIKTTAPFCMPAPELPAPKPVAPEPAAPEPAAPPRS